MKRFATAVSWGSSACREVWTGSCSVAQRARIDRAMAIPRIDQGFRAKHSAIVAIRWVILIGMRLR
ncbi:MAG: hypothetical protein ACXWTG_08585 [Methylosarcina sp.]